MGFYSDDEVFGTELGEINAAWRSLQADNDT